MGKGSPEFPEIFILRPIRHCMKPGSLQHRTGKCVFCTDTRIKFLGSPFAQLAFDIINTLVQTRYRVKRSREFPQISIFGPVRRCMKSGTLQPRTGKCAFCTDIRITILGSPFSQLPFDMIIALVQTRYRAKKKPRIS